ncbi:hypothetical protein D9M68_677560 [compost metagenome]
MVEMVLQILADARQVVHHRNTQALKLSGWANSGQLQELRRAECAGTQNDLTTRAHLLQFVTLIVGDATGALAFHDQLR